MSQLPFTVKFWLFISIQIWYMKYRTGNHFFFLIDYFIHVINKRETVSQAEIFRLYSMKTANAHKNNQSLLHYVYLCIDLKLTLLSYLIIIMTGHSKV